MDRVGAAQGVHGRSRRGSRSSSSERICSRISRQLFEGQLKVVCFSGRRADQPRGRRLHQGVPAEPPPRGAAGRGPEARGRRKCPPTRVSAQIKGNQPVNQPGEDDGRGDEDLPSSSLELEEDIHARSQHLLSRSCDLTHTHPQGGRGHVCCQRSSQILIF